MLYPMIFKRKSFHLFKDTEHISASELDQINSFFSACTPLCRDIQVDMQIVPAAKTTKKATIANLERIDVITPSFLEFFSNIMLRDG